MLDKSKRYLIVGLGLLGGKYALELTRAGYTVDGINRSEGHLQFALDHGYIRSGKTHDFEDLVQSADHIIFALYPTAMIEWFKTYGSLLKPGCIFTDVSGVKTGLEKRKSWYNTYRRVRMRGFCVHRLCKTPETASLPEIAIHHFIYFPTPLYTKTRCQAGFCVCMESFSQQKRPRRVWSASAQRGSFAYDEVWRMALYIMPRRGSS